MAGAAAGAGRAVSPGQFVWPLYYFLFFAAVLVIARHTSARNLAIILAAVAIVQAVDTSRGWLYDNPYLRLHGAGYPTKFTSQFWTRAGARYRAVRIAPHSLNGYLDIATFARAHAMATDAAYLSRTSTQATETSRQRTAHAIARANGRPIRSSSSMKTRPPRQLHARSSRNFLARADGVIVLAPNWAGCADCGAVPYR